MLETYFGSVMIAIDEINVSRVQSAIDILSHARASHNRVWLVGNGGSASTASHFANDLQKMCDIDVVCLPNNIPTILAYGNDNGWENMFSDAMIGFKNEDVLIAISCSGTSKNVLEAVKMAGRGHVIALTGHSSENELMHHAEVAIPVMSGDIKVQEDVHLCICHAIAGALAL